MSKDMANSPKEIFLIVFDSNPSDGLARHAIENKNCLLIVDDLKARKLAAELNIKYTGSLGIIADAKFTGHIKLIKPILEKIRKTNFRLTPELEKEILSKAGE